MDLSFLVYFENLVLSRILSDDRNIKSSPEEVERVYTS